MKKNFAGDTHGDPLLDEFCLNIMKERAKSTSMFGGIDVYFLRNLFPVKVMLTTAGDKKVSIEFPINHINVKRETRQWQVETGPVLTPLGKNEGVPDYLPAFDHFNSFDKIDILCDYSFGRSTLDPLNKRIHSNVSCTIHLYA